MKMQPEFWVHVQGDGLMCAARASFPNESQARAFVRLLSAAAEWLILRQQNEAGSENEAGSGGSGLGSYERLDQSPGWDAYIKTKATAAELTIVKA